MQRCVVPTLLTTVSPAHFSPAFCGSGSDVQYWKVALLPSDSTALLHFASASETVVAVSASAPLMHCVDLGSSCESLYVATCRPPSAASISALTLLSRVVDVEVWLATLTAAARSSVMMNRMMIAVGIAKPRSQPSRRSGGMPMGVGSVIRSGSRREAPRVRDFLPAPLR